MKATSPGFCALYSETEKQLRSTIAAAGGALKHCVRSFHGQPGALSWLAKTDVSMSTLPSIRCTPAFFSVATILRISCRLSVGSPPKRAIRSPFSTPPSREPLVSSVVVKRKSGPSCSSAASAVMTFAYWPGAPFAGCDSRFPASMRRPFAP